MITAIDIGCRWAEKESWANQEDFHVIGFDPDRTEIARLQTAAPRHEWYAHALGSEAGTKPWHSLKYPDSSSVLEPVSDAPWSSPLHFDEHESKGFIEIRTLDSLGFKPEFLKIDVQGYEIEVFKGAEETLKSVLVLRTEVMFNPMYIGQPLFGEIDAFLRARGFRLWDIFPFEKCGGQLMWSDAYFVSKITDTTFRIMDVVGLKP